MNKKCFYIPSVINEQYFMLWKRDEVIFLMLPAVLFFAIGGLSGFLLAMLGIIVMSMVIKSLGVDRRSGYMMHWLKFNLPEQALKSLFYRKQELDKQSSLFLREKAFPPSHIRHIAG